MSWFDSLGRFFGTGPAKLSGPEVTSDGTSVRISRGNASGKPVTLDSALQLSTAWSCIRLLSETIATLPIGMYEETAAGKRTAKDHDLYGLLHDSPNGDQTAIEFWEAQVASLCLVGNGYAERVTLGNRTTALNQLPCGPGQVHVFRTAEGARRYRFPDRGKMEELPEEKMFHLRGFGVGGDVGLSPIGYARQTMGAALAADEVAASMFGSGLHLSGFVQQKNEPGSKPLTGEQIDQLAEAWSRWAGSKNAGRIMPLQPGMVFTALAMNPEDAQLLQTRAFHVEEICRWFRVPPFMVGHTEKSTSWGTGLEQQMIGFIMFSLAPYLKRIEQAVKKQLMPVSDRLRFYPEFNLEGLLRADSAGRAALYSAFGQNGVMSREEMRAKENLPPEPTAGFLTVQSNLVRLDQLGAGGGSDAAQARAALRAWLIEEEKRDAA